MSKITPIKPKVTGIIHNWFVQLHEGTDYYIILGDIYSDIHGRFPDGKYIHTSHILEADHPAKSLKTKDIVATMNSTYFLGRPKEASLVVTNSILKLTTDELFDKIIQWGVDRNIIGGSSPEAQFDKVEEEMEELRHNIANSNNIADDVGDMMVALTMCAAQLDLSPRECLQVAWDEIKDRKGKLIDGVFVKESDLTETFGPLQTLASENKLGQKVYPAHGGYPNPKTILE